jgi:hypothetical protein
MRFTKEDEQLLERVFSDKNMDLEFLEPLLRRFAAIKDSSEAEHVREMLEAVISFQRRNRAFEVEHGISIDCASFQLIEEGDFQPVLDLPISPVRVADRIVKSPTKR